MKLSIMEDNPSVQPTALPDPLPVMSLSTNSLPVTSLSTVSLPVMSLSMNSSHQIPQQTSQTAMVKDRHQTEVAQSITSYPTASDEQTHNDLNYVTIDANFNNQFHDKEQITWIKNDLYASVHIQQ